MIASATVVISPDRLFRLGVQPRLVFDVADRDALPVAVMLPAEVGGLGELVPPAFGEVEGAVVQAAAFLRVHVQRLQLLKADQAEERVAALRGGRRGSRMGVPGPS